MTRRRCDPILAEHDAATTTRTDFARMLLAHAEWQLGDWDGARGGTLAWSAELADQTPDPHYRASADCLSALTEADSGHLERGASVRRARAAERDGGRQTRLAIANEADARSHRARSPATTDAAADGSCARSPTACCAAASLTGSPT